MQNNYMENILNKSKRRRFLKRVLALLSSVVILLTANTLKFNADTLVRAATCGYPDHEHTLDCYNSAGELICEEHVHTEACYQASAVEDTVEDVVSDSIEAPVEEMDAFELGEAEEGSDEAPFELTEAVAAEAEPEYLVGSQEVILLSEMLQDLEMDISGIVEVGQVFEDDDASVLINVSKVGEDYEIRPLGAFDEIELAVETEDDIVLIKLVESWVENREAAEEDVTDRDAVESDQASETVDAKEIQADAEAPSEEIEAAEETVVDSPVEDDRKEDAPEQVVKAEESDEESPAVEPEKELTDVTVEENSPEADEAGEGEPVSENDGDKLVEKDETDAEKTFTETDTVEDITDVKEGTDEGDAEQASEEQTTPEDEPDAEQTAETDVDNGEQPDEDSETVEKQTVEVEETETEAGSDAETEAEDDSDDVAASSVPAYTFSEEKAVLLSDVLSEMEIDVDLTECDVELSEDAPIRLDVQEEPFDYLLTAEDYFESATLTLTSEDETFEILLRNPEPGISVAAGDEFTSADGKAVVTFEHDVVLPAGTALMVVESQPEFDDATLEKVNAALAEANAGTAEDARWFDISLGEVHDIDALVTLEADFEGLTNAVVAHIRQDGDVDILTDTSLSDGVLTFATDGFSLFGVSQVTTSRRRGIMRAPQSANGEVDWNEYVKYDGAGKLTIYEGCPMDKIAAAISAGTSPWDTYADGDISEIVLESGITSIPSNFLNNSKFANVSKVTIPNTVTEIGANAFKGSQLTEVEIPGSVTSIGEGAFSNCADLTDVTFASANRMTTLSKGIFSGCTALENVTLPKNLSSVSESAFENCTALTEINLPKNLEHIEKNAFKGCTSLERAALEGSDSMPRYLKDIGDSAFEGCAALNDFTFSGNELTKIGASAFSGCTSITSVELPESVTSLGSKAFYECSNLEYVDLSETQITKLEEATFDKCTSLEDIELADGITELGKGALRECTSLKSIDLPENLKTIGDSAFSLCANLDTINGGKKGALDLPEGITTIGTSAFNGCNGFTKLNVPNSVTSLGGSAFISCKNLEEATIGTGITDISGCTSLFMNDAKLRKIDFQGNITAIPSNAFNGCANLEEFPLHEGLKTIGSSAFAGCTHLTEAKFPKTLTSIGASAYSGCTNLTSASFDPDGSTTTIGNYAFQNCTSLTEVHFPKALTSIGQYAYNGCSNLASTTFEEGTNSLTINERAFQNCTSLKEVTFPSNLKNIGTYAYSGCTLLEKVEFTDGDYSKNPLTIGTYAFQSLKNLKEVKFPSNLHSIGDYAFRYCTALTELDFPKNLRTIGQYAFAGDSSNTMQIRKVTFPEDSELTTIYNYAFAYNNKLTQIKLPEKLTTISNYAFRSCTAMTSVEFPTSGSLKSINTGAFRYCSSLQEVTIPEGVTTLGQYALQYCDQLQRIVLPSTLKSTSTNAFSYDYALKEVVFPDTFTTIAGSLFYGDTGLETVTIPRDVSSITNSALYGVSRLKNLIWDAKNYTLGSAFSSIGTKFTVTLGKNVDNFPANTLTYLINSGANRLAFEGPNDLTLPNMKGKNIQFPLSQLTGGDYYADEHGALYEIKDGAATLVYVPDSLTEYTIPTQITRASGAVVPVTGVKANAFYEADALTTLNIEDPSALTPESFAFAYAEKLAKVVDQRDGGSYTTRKTATELFGGGVQLFYQTALTDDTDTTDWNLPETGALHYGATPNGKDYIYDSYDAEWNGSGISVDITQGGASYRDTSEKGYADETYNVPNRDEDDTFLFFTGEAITTNIVISNPQSVDLTDPNNPFSKNDKFRVYFQADDNFKTSYGKVGQTYSVEGKKKDADGNITTEGSITFELHETDVPGVYYYEFARPTNGATYTISMDWNCYKSPTSPGADVKIWAEYVKADDLNKDAGKAILPEPKQQNINVTTLPNPQTLEKSHSASSTNVGVKRVGEDIYVKSHSYTIKMLRDTDYNVRPNQGQDYVRYIDLVDTLDCSEGMKVNEILKQEIAEGKLVYKGNTGSSKTIESPTLGTIFTFSSSSSSDYSNYRTPRLSVTEDGRLQLEWRFNNTSTTAEIGPHTVNMTVGEGVLCLEEIPEITEEKPYIFANSVDATVHYTFSDEQELHDDDTHNIIVGKADFTFKKTGSSSGYRGEDSPYTLTLTSTNALPVTTDELKSIVDNLDYNNGSYMHYLDAEGIWKLFMDDDDGASNKAYGDVLTLTVKGAHLYGWEIVDDETTKKLQKLKVGDDDVLSGTNRTVIGTNGAVITTTDANGNKISAQTDQENTSYDTSTKYSGTSVSAKDIYDKIKDAVFVFTKDKTSDQLCYTLKTSAGVELGSGILKDADAVQTMLDGYGFFVTSTTKYETRWNIEDKEEFALQGDESIVLKIPAKLKDAFMRLNGDSQRYEQTSSLTYNNMATAYKDVGDKTPVNSTASGTHSYDAELYKGATIVETETYEDEYTPAVDYPTALEYTVTAVHRGKNSYKVMPVTDHMTGRQALLVPVWRNNQQDWAQDLGKDQQVDVNGEKYYVLNVKRIYEKVWTGNAWADHVVVQKTGDDTYDTKLFWYLPNYGGDRTYKLTYKAQTWPNPKTIASRHIVDYYNESWLGDHESHRLWNWTGDYGGMYATAPIVDDFDKKIVERVNDTSEGTEYCPITNGCQVIYRLSFTKEDWEDFVLTGKDLYDYLPQNCAGFTWKKNENIHISYLNADVVNDNWTISYVAGNQYQIKWPDNFSMTCNNESGIMYIYVTLDFPTDTAWTTYVQTYGNSQLFNTLYVRNRFGNFDQKFVWHDLADQVNARLQKGVYATGGIKGGIDYYRKDDNARLTYENDDMLKRKVYYYITLHNDSYTNLYLNDIQDVLPEGFTLAENPTLVLSNNTSYATVTRGSGPSSTYLNRYSNSTVVLTGKETLDDGRQRVTMTLKPYKYYQKNGYMVSEPQYHEVLERYYLAPGQAAIIRLECYTNGADPNSLDPDRRNVVSMPYYDAFDQGLEVANSTSTAYGDGTKNDGGCEIIDNTEAQAMGFDTTGVDNTTQWLESDVTVTRGDIRPGLNKFVLKTIVDGEDSDKTLAINTQDTVVWQMDASNDGDRAILDYVITDDLPNHYNFAGPVTFQQFFNPSSFIGPVELFNIERTGQTVDGVNYVPDAMRFVNSAHPRGIAYNIGDDEVEITVPNWESKKIYVKIVRDPNTENEIMSIRFKDNSMGIPAGGHVSLTIQTPPLLAQLGVLSNQISNNYAYVTPLNQKWDGNTNRGSVVSDLMTPWGAGDTGKSVRSNAMVVSTYGGSTTSIKTVEEKGNLNNHANSNGEPRDYITVQDKNQHVTYTLSVTNQDTSAKKKMVLIDNLPQKNDHTTFQTTDPRGSDFMMKLAENPKFNLVLYEKGENGENGKTISLKDYYVIQWSDKVDISASDWSGADSKDWHVIDEDHPVDVESARSFRLIFTDPNADSDPTGKSYLFQQFTKIEFTFDAQIGGDAEPGKIAWNSFGYRVTNNIDVDLDASPLKVGVRIPDLPHVEKFLVNARKQFHAAEKKLTFKYIMYDSTEDADVTNAAANGYDAVIKAIQSKKHSYVELEVYVPEGNYKSQDLDLFSFNNKKGHQYPDYNESVDWTMVSYTDQNKQWYTIIEAATGDHYTPDNINEEGVRSYSFTFNANEGSKLIRSVNMHDDWSLSFHKQDQLERPVSGAVFAFYSPVEVEAYKENKEKYDELSVEEINRHFGVALTKDEKPAYAYIQGVNGKFMPANDIVPNDGNTYYRLKTIRKTNDLGIFQLNDLNGEQYLYVELQAPEGYRLDGTVKTVTPPDNRKEVKVLNEENTYEADDTVYLVANKQLVGRPLKDGQFRFELEGYDVNTKRTYADGDPKMPPMPAVTTVSNIATPEGTNISFGPINVTATDIGKIYYYKISEIIPKAGEAGYDEKIKYDTKAYIVKATITDEGAGQLGIDLKYSWFDDKGREIAVNGVASFVNVFTGTTGITLPIQKTLNGRTWISGDAYTFELVSTGENVDARCPLTVTLTPGDSVNTDDPLTGDLAVTFDKDHYGKEWHYILREQIPAAAIGYNAATMEKVRVTRENGIGKDDLKYDRYRLLSDDARRSLGIPDSVRWKLNGMLYDGATHELVVEVKYDEAGNQLYTESTLDGQSLPLDENVAFENRFMPDNIPATVEVQKRFDGRPWLDDTYDTYYFKIIPGGEGYPMPTSGDVLTMIKNPTPVGSEDFKFSLKWTDLDDENGVHQTERVFTYKIVELTQPDPETGIKVPVTEGYKYDQVTYDASVHTVTLTLKDLGNNKMGATVTYPEDTEDDTNQAASFTNHYETEPVPLPIRVTKHINGKSARQRSFRFELYGEDGTLIDTIDLAADDENGGVTEKLITSVMLEEHQTAKYTLREVIPVAAKAYDKTTGKPVPETETGTQLTYGEASDDQKKSEDILWILDGMTYDSTVINVKVTDVVLDTDESYRLIPQVEYSKSEKDTALFENKYEANGQSVIGVEKTLEGADDAEEFKFKYELTAIGGAPLRANGVKKDKLTLTVASGQQVSFDTLQFEIGDLMDTRRGGWSEKIFEYRVHEDIPGTARAYNLEDKPLNKLGEVLEDEVKEPTTDEETPLTYEKASDEQKASMDIRWRDKGILYDQDHIVKIRVADNGHGALTVTYPKEDENEEDAATAPLIQSVNKYSPSPVSVSFRVRKLLRDGEAICSRTGRTKTTTGRRSPAASPLR